MGLESGGRAGPPTPDGASLGFPRPETNSDATGHADQQIVTLQYLRAVAATLVVIFHISQSSLARNSKIEPLNLGQSGVDIFFVISGFIIVYSTHIKSASEFLKRRLIRIVPLYWTFTALLFLGKFGDLSRATSPIDLTRSLLFIPYFNSQHGGYYPILVPGWTINYEMYFYVLFAIMIRCELWIKIFIFFGIFSALTGLGVAIGGSHLFLEFYGNPIVLEFAFGMLIALAFRFRPKPPPLIGLASVAAGLTILLVSPDPPDRVLTWGLAAAAIVWGSLVIEGSSQIPRSRSLATLGDASYAIYITHTLILSAVTLIWRQMHLAGPLAKIAFYGIALGAVLLGGILTHRWVEAPITKSLKRGLRTRGAAAVSNAAG